MVAETFGQRLSRLRKRRGLTMRFVAAETGLALTSYWQLEHDKCEPMAGTLERLASVYGCTMDALWLGIEARAEVVRG